MKNKSIDCMLIVRHHLNIATNTCGEQQKLLLKIIYDWYAIIYVHLCKLNRAHSTLSTLSSHYQIVSIHLFMIIITLHDGNRMLAKKQWILIYR